MKGEKIGQGSYGTVYQGLDLVKGTFLAIREIKIPVDMMQMFQSLRLVQNEMALLKGLNNPNVIQFYGAKVSLEKRMIDLAMEYVPGGSIRSLLDQFISFQEKLAKVYVRQILNGLCYLHLHNIVHRNLRCSNLLLDANGMIKISDFGTAKKVKILGMLEANEIEEEETFPDALFSFPSFLAPEILERKENGKEADIWSLGCLLIEMLTSKPAWVEYDGKVEKIMKAINNKRKPDYPPNISNECRDFLD
mmetsp:Transcript_44963/g.43538  ORF Transcript_44963/g.43538 Transcript_44963/m.43538 type:complete len:249 (+) Transcript_44963:1034-1780(+)